MNSIRYSPQAYDSFFQRLHFVENPFASTNADEEERLPDYFVPPPYFPSVFGDPRHPKSFFVFAPRGGGKSAQRRMIENRCAEEQVLAITYDQFEFPSLAKASDVTLHNHLQQIVRRCLMGLLVFLSAEPSRRDNLKKHDREILVQLSVQYLGGITAESLRKTLDSLKSLKNKVQDFWNEWLPVIGPMLNVLLQKLTGVDINQVGAYQAGVTGASAQQSKYELRLVVELAQKLGFQSVYVLIDRVDEAELTGNDAVASFALIRPLVRDLDLLELRGLGFKFFLWDQLESLYLDTARTDRVRHETLEWDDEMFIQMWKKRLSAYSEGKVSSLAQVSEVIPGFSIDQLALVFANHSPRDMIRIGAQVIAEQQEIDLFSERISQRAIITGLNKFCALRAGELLTTRTLNDLRKVQHIDFTIPYLAGQVFREQQVNTRNRISRWRREGAIVELERIDNPNPQQKRPVKLFAIADVRVAREIASEITLMRFLETKHKKCPKCGNDVLRDWGDHDSSSRCDVCQFDLLSEQDQDGLESWRRRDLAAEVRRQRRRERLDEGQLALFDPSQSDGE